MKQNQKETAFNEISEKAKTTEEMTWNYIIGAIVAILCGGSTVERLLIFFGFSISVGISDIVDMLKIKNNEKQNNQKERP